MLKFDYIEVLASPQASFRGWAMMAAGLNGLNNIGPKRDGNEYWIANAFNVIDTDGNVQNFGVFLVHPDFVSRVFAFLNSADFYGTGIAGYTQGGIFGTSGTAILEGVVRMSRPNGQSGNATNPSNNGGRLATWEQWGTHGILIPPGWGLLVTEENNTVTSSNRVFGFRMSVIRVPLTCLPAAVWAT